MSAPLAKAPARAPRAASGHGRLRRQLTVVIAVLAAANLGLLGWLLSPQAPSQAATQQQLAATRAQWVALRTQDAQLQRLQGRLQSSQTQVQELMAEGIPREDEAPAKLLTELHRVSQVSQVELSGADFHPDRYGHLGLRRYTIGLQVSGSYAGAVRFINTLERSPMFFIIDQVSVTGGRANAAGGQPGGADPVKLELQLEMYVQSDAPEAPKTNAGGATP